MLTRFATNVFKLFSSAVSSFNLASLLSSWAFSAFGINDCSALTSSLIRLLSSSRRLLEVFISCVTCSTSARAESRRSFRDSSDALMVAVSVASWSIKAKARVKDSSMADLSCSSWGGVGGAIKGAMYRWMSAVSSAYANVLGVLYLCTKVQSIAQSAHDSRHDEVISPITPWYPRHHISIRQSLIHSAETPNSLRRRLLPIISLI